MDESRTRGQLSLWRFEHYILKPSAVIFLILGMAFLIIKVWLEGAMFLVACFLTYSFAANLHWDAKTRTFPKDWHKDDFTGIDTELAKFRFGKSVLAFSLQIGVITAIMHMRFHQEWYYILLGGFIGMLAAGVISAMVSIRPWPR